MNISCCISHDVILCGWLGSKHQLTNSSCIYVHCTSQTVINISHQSIDATCCEKVKPGVYKMTSDFTLSIFHDSSKTLQKKKKKKKWHHLWSTTMVFWDKWSIPVLFLWKQECMVEWPEPWRTCLKRLLEQWHLWQKTTLRQDTYLSRPFPFSFFFFFWWPFFLQGCLVTCNSIRPTALEFKQQMKGINTTCLTSHIQHGLLCTLFQEKAVVFTENVWWGGG